MVCEWGMSEELGPLTFGKKEEMVFLGKELAHERDYSEATQQKIDKEIRRLVEGSQDKALQILRENEDKLHALALALLEREILDAPEIDKLIKGETLDPVDEGPGPEKTEKAEEPEPTRKPKDEPTGGISPSPDPHPGPA